MKIFNHRGTENTEGLYALSLPNLEAIRDELIKLMTKKIRASVLKMRLGELVMGRPPFPSFGSKLLIASAFDGL